MAYKINVDNYSFCASPEETVSSYAAELAKKLAAAEEQARIAADNSLSIQLKQEIDKRKSGDAALSEAVSNEAAARQAADASLTSALSNEASIRAVADSEIESRLDGFNLKNGSAQGSLRVVTSCKEDGEDNYLMGKGSFAEGQMTKTVGEYSHAEGSSSAARGDASHAEGVGTYAIGYASHAEGEGTLALGYASHAEGVYSHTSAYTDHAEGYDTSASGYASHAEGDYSIASGHASHAEGYVTAASGDASHAEGRSTYAIGGASHAEGVGTYAQRTASHVEGQYNVIDTEKKYLHIAGNGSSDDSRSNAHTLDFEGNAWFAGNVTVGKDALALATLAEVSDMVSEKVDYDKFSLTLEAKADKAIIERSIAAAYDFEFSNTDNTEKRLAEVANISFTFGNGEYNADYISGLSFDSGATPTAIDYADSGILNWVGTDCTTSEGLSIFQPSPNTHYDIIFYFNGRQFIGLVNGYVPATGNEAV